MVVLTHARRVALRVRPVDISTRFKQLLRDADVTQLGGEVQRRAAISLRHIQVTTCSQSKHNACKRQPLQATRAVQ